MTAQQKIDAKDSAPVSKTGLALLREPFPAHQISKLPKPTKRQTDEVKADFKKGIRCQMCGQWHHPQVQHLDYVGHAALTDRLLDCDPKWNWEPLAFNERGLPATDDAGGMWIKLTVCDQTRFGYGHADGKRGGDAIKEVIGDALRNAAMRFGAALDLWHKGDLHGPSDDPAEDETEAEKPEPHQPKPEGFPPEAVRVSDAMLAALGSKGLIVTDDPRFKADLARLKDRVPDLAAKVDAEIAKLREAQKGTENVDLGGDEIPY